MLADVMYKSESQHWETPQELFEELDREFKFNIDVCASHQNRKCSRYISKSEDALKMSWSIYETAPTHCFMNPPYGREIIKFIQKAYIESLKGNLVVCLVPARTDTRWWSIFWDRENHRPKENVEVRFLSGRVKFKKDGSINNAPFPSAIVIMKPHRG